MMQRKTQFEISSLSRKIASIKCALVTICPAEGHKNQGATRWPRTPRENLGRTYENGDFTLIFSRERLSAGFFQ